MGYSHHWLLDITPINATSYKRTALDAKLVLVATLAEYRLRVREDEDRVLVDGPRDATCETFILHATRRGIARAVATKRQLLERQSPHWTRAELQQQSRFDFVKTNRHPYDDVVVACLCLLAESGLPVTSDSDAADWERGRQLAAHVLGCRVQAPPGIGGCQPTAHSVARKA